MRVLTVRQPWAWAIIHGGKHVENRSRNIAGDYRGPVAIHAAAREAERYHQAAEEIYDRAGTYVLKAPQSAIVGVVDLVDVHKDDRCDDKAHPHTPGELACSSWAMADHHHLVLTNPRPLTNPIRARGRLGLWKPDEDLEQAIAAALAEVTR
ncbi:ASCH domain-containing protein [Demequina gelatinilytica]|uniref:ASCH domain-containing protein n=1 Tax=Demequina gelatinilytica TaxID=1638980 RepID=UPI00078575C5|nr:ASCH domain-containing protein [Demequina gelatinilytica]